MMMTYSAWCRALGVALLVSVPAPAGGHDRVREVRTCSTNMFGVTHCTVKVDGRVVEHVTCTMNRFGTTSCRSTP
jgi:hypothetical protein